MEGYQYMQRKSKYSMIEMELATKLVTDRSKENFPIGVEEVDVKGMTKQLVFLYMLTSFL